MILLRSNSRADAFRLIRGVEKFSASPCCDISGGTLAFGDILLQELQANTRRFTVGYIVDVGKRDDIVVSHDRPKRGC